GLLRSLHGQPLTPHHVNGADVGLASVKQNNALKGVWTQWAFLLCRRCLSIAACSAGMLSRWHTERQSRTRPFQVPPPEKHQWNLLDKYRFEDVPVCNLVDLSPSVCLPLASPFGSVDNEGGEREMCKAAFHYEIVCITVIQRASCSLWRVPDSWVGNLRD
ncbi:hypothetical protein KUCAC02_009920, partial [Chaenocephalus aceratus]